MAVIGTATSVIREEPTQASLGGQVAPILYDKLDTIDTDINDGFDRNHADLVKFNDDMVSGFSTMNTNQQNILAGIQETNDKIELVLEKLDAMSEIGTEVNTAMQDIINQYIPEIKAKQDAIKESIDVAGSNIDSLASTANQLLSDIKTNTTP